MFKALLILAISLTVTQSLYPYAEENHIINLGEPTWDIALNEFPNGILIYFYEPYCFPCRQFWSELVTAAQNLNITNSSVRIAKVECHDEVKLCDQKGVTSFPTINLYRKDKEPAEYRGARTAADLEKWVTKIVEANYEERSTLNDAFTRFSTIILFKDKNDALIKAYQDLFDETEIAQASSLLHGKLNNANQVLFTQRGETIDLPDDAASIITSVREVLDIKSKKAIPNFNADLSKALQSDDIDLNLVLLFRVNDYSYDSEIVKSFEQAYNEINHEKFRFAYVNVEDDILGSTIARLFGIDENSETTVGTLSKRGRIIKKYKGEEKFTTESIKKLVEDVSSGNGARYYMSAETVVQKDPYVKELTGDEYQTTTEDSSKNAFVMLYFPWCEWCVKLEPTLKALAYRFKDDKDLIIGRIDVSQNDVKGYDMSEYPVLLFYPKGNNKQGEIYLGDQNMMGLKKFLFGKIPSLQNLIDL